MTTDKSILFGIQFIRDDLVRRKREDTFSDGIQYKDTYFAVLESLRDSELLSNNLFELFTTEATRLFDAKSPDARNKAIKRFVLCAQQRARLVHTKLCSFEAAHDYVIGYGKSLIDLELISQEELDNYMKDWVANI